MQTHTAPSTELSDRLPPWRHVLAVVAHPDDESFGLGAVLDHLISSGAQVRVLCLTEGEASTVGPGPNLRQRRREELAENLSHGEQRYLEICLALATAPRLLLLDEPTAGMTPGETRDATALIRRIAEERGLTVLLIEHDMSVVMGISDRVAVLHFGEKIAEGTPEQIRNDPRVIDAYLGGADD